MHTVVVNGALIRPEPVSDGQNKRTGRRVLWASSFEPLQVSQLHYHSTPNNRPNAIRGMGRDCGYPTPSLYNSMRSLVAVAHLLLPSGVASNDGSDRLGN